MPPSPSPDDDDLNPADEAKLLHYTRPRVAAAARRTLFNIEAAGIPLEKERRIIKLLAQNEKDLVDCEEQSLDLVKQSRMLKQRALSAARCSALLGQCESAHHVVPQWWNSLKTIHKQRLRRVFTIVKLPNGVSLQPRGTSPKRQRKPMVHSVRDLKSDSEEGTGSSSEADGRDYGSVAEAEGFSTTDDDG